MIQARIIKELIKKNYNLDVNKITKIKDGSADLYILDSFYVVKFYQDNFKLQKIKKGIDISNYFHKLSYKTPIYYKTINGKYYFCYKKRYVVLMNYIKGKKISAFNASTTMIKNSSKFYSKFISDLQNYDKELPFYDFDKYFVDNIDKSISDYLRLINDTNNIEIKNDLQLRIDLLKKINLALFSNIDKITICNCHGDFYISQCLYKKNEIMSILDFESAKVMPIAIELFRSYIYFDKKFNIDNLIMYINEFIKNFKLNYYDLSYMPYLYYLKLLQSDFGYKQYVENDSKKDEFIKIGKKLQEQIIFLSYSSEIISNKLTTFINYEDC